MEKVSEVDLVRKDIAVVAGPRGWSDTRESWLARVPRRVKTVTYRTVKALWYGEIANPEHWAARDIHRAAQLIEGRKEATALAAQYRTILGGLNARDPDFHGPEIAALLSVLRQLGDPDSPGTEGEMK